MFLTCEGVDGSGKGMVIDELKDVLPPNTVFTQEPSQLWTGEQVRRAINKDDTHPMADYHLFVSDRAEHVNNIIKPALRNGKMVVCDRYKDSTRAYQKNAIEGYVGDMTVKKYIENNMSWAPEPDLTLLLDVDVETSVERTGERDKYEKREFLQNVRQNYLEIYEESKNSDRTIVKIDGTNKKNTVVDECIEKVLKFIENEPQA